MKNTLTQSRLKEVLSYDPITGVFTWVGTTKDGRGQRSDRLGQPCLPGSRGYVEIGIDGWLYRANRLAVLYMTGAWPVGEVDHKNTNPSDDRWVNLRDVTHRQNMMNQRIRKNSTTRVTGVSWDSVNEKWRAHITLHAKLKTLGRFKEFDAAVAARKEAEAEHFGQYARSA